MNLEQSDLLDSDDRNINQYHCFVKIFGSILLELNICLLYDPTILYPVIYPGEMNAYVQPKDMSKTLVLFIMVKMRKIQVLSTVDWINMLW